MKSQRMRARSTRLDWITRHSRDPSHHIHAIAVYNSFWIDYVSVRSLSSLLALWCARFRGRNNWRVEYIPFTFVIDLFTFSYSSRHAIYKKAFQDFLAFNSHRGEKKKKKNKRQEAYKRNQSSLIEWKFRLNQMKKQLNYIAQDDWVENQYAFSPPPLVKSASTAAGFHRVIGGTTTLAE